MTDKGATHAIFFEVETWTRLNCQPYEASSMSALLSLARYAPQVIQFLMYFAGVRYRELYLLLFGLGLSLDSLVNLGLNQLIDGGEPRVATCPPVHGTLTSFQTQQTAFFVVFSLGFASLYRPRLKYWHVLALCAFYLLVALSDHFLNYHRANAIVSGAFFGTTLALIYQTLLHWLVVPWLARISSWTFVVYMSYRDTLTGYGRVREPLFVRVARDFRTDFPEPLVGTSDVVRWLAHRVPYELSEEDREALAKASK